ncbi:gamma-glutamylcyclotransferase [Roseomonas sp. GC11]|uniref:gamma-glutamylcyclotransferase family protein n=1 Tax=Roseomonas sp. GC11 TaxID=2950546 RepID=UPI00210C753C|nr:gamma-glutamylcyclotransferase family protein [Roseomonas sp. GC11]MCQ4162615.1 gamma-glutamylcyclotransferase [Roseomonas sp. GC11]
MPGTDRNARGAAPGPRRGDAIPPDPAIRGPLFLYGTLLDPRLLARHAGTAGLHRRGVPATLPEHRRGRLRGTPYPTLLPAPGHAVQGLLIRPGAGALKKLQNYEGAAYRLLPLRVRTRRGLRWARAWVVPPWRAAA